MNRTNEPLSPEERDLAARLARLGGPREPAPALDAAILAASRQAVSGVAAETAVASASPSEDSRGTVVPLRRRTPMQRWPVGLGLAATMVLAIGIGWRLHGDGDGFSRAMGEAPAAAPEAAADAAASAGEEEFSMQAVILEPETVRTPPPPPPPEQVATELKRVEPAVRSLPAAEPPQVPAAQHEPAHDHFTMDEAVPVDAATTSATAASAAAKPAAAADTVAAPAPPPVGRAAATAPPAEAFPADHARRAKIQSAPTPDEEQLDTITVTGGRLRRDQDAAPAPVTTMSRESMPEARQNSASASSEAFYDQPPASADTPEVRLAWLQRIRDLIVDGETDAARDSLQEFRRRYPDVELPEDLRKWAATLPPPKP